MHSNGSVPTFSNPELHVQSVMLVFAVIEFVFAGQAMQEELHFVLLYVPAIHAVHGPPSGPVRLNPHARHRTHFHLVVKHDHD